MKDPSEGSVKSHAKGPHMALKGLIGAFKSPHKALKDLIGALKGLIGILKGTYKAPQGPL